MNVKARKILYISVIFGGIIGIPFIPKVLFLGILVNAIYVGLLVAIYFDKEYRNKYVPHITDKFAVVMLCISIALFIIQILIHVLTQ